MMVVNPRAATNSFDFHRQKPYQQRLSVNDADEWEVLPIDEGQPSKFNIGQTMNRASLAADSPNDESIFIYADLLIPGRGQPIKDAAVGISAYSGIITYVGTQDQLSAPFASAPRIHVVCLLPGLWDCHTHFSGVTKVDFPEMALTHPAACGAAIARGFHDTLMAGFTSVRDVGSYALEAATAVEKGLILGPNVYGAGAAIGITGGSCDAHTLPVDVVYSRQGTNHGDPWPGSSSLVIADGIEECRRAVRQQIRRGAQCIKIVATGGVLSTKDDPKFRQFTDEELRVMVEEATLQGRSVAVHAHGKSGIVAAIKAGAKTIEHGSYLDEDTAKLMSDHGTTLVATRHVIEAGLRHLDTLNPETAKKMVQVADSHLRAYKIAIRCGVRIALGTDIAGADPRSETSPGHNGAELLYAVRAGLTPLQAIEAATANASETLGELAPKKGLVKAGWDADLIALDENPLDNIALLADPLNVKYVWKAARLVKAPGQLFWPPKPGFYST